MRRTCSTTLLGRERQWPEEFWASTPSWRPDSARVEVGGEQVVWSDAGLFTVHPVAGVVAAFLDGTVTLATLADDVAFATDAPVEQARQLVAQLAVELSSLAALDGVVVPGPPPAGPEPAAASALPDEEGESYRFDPESGEEIRVVTAVDADGHLVTTEYLPDGRRRISTTMTFSSAQADQAMTAAEVLAGDRSAAELVPLTSCLGSKLRNHDDVPLVSIRGADGKVRSVRCHHPEVAERLRALAGSALVEDGRGPVEAFVVTPLEGHGPMRIFDGHGHRRGRPRTVEDVVAVVDQILGERAVAAVEPTDDAPLPVDLVLLGAPDGSGVLVPRAALEGVGVTHRLVVAGWTPTVGRALVAADGTVAAPSGLGAPSCSARQVQVVVDGDTTAADRIGFLVGELPDDGTARATRLTGLAGFAQHARWAPPPPELAQVLEALPAADA